MMSTDNADLPPPPPPTPTVSPSEAFAGPLAPPPLGTTDTPVDVAAGAVPAPAAMNAMAAPTEAAAAPVPAPPAFAPLPAPPGPWDASAGSSLRPPRPRKASLALLIAVTTVSFIADIASKGWVKDHLTGLEGRPRGGHHLQIIKGHLEFIFAQNPGGAWSFLRSMPDSLRRPFFLAVSAAAMVFIVAVYRRIYRDQTGMKLGLPLALGGAAGNLADRIRYGWVIDFIDVFITQRGREIHWPTFNVADIAIVVGVVLMALDMLFRKRAITEPGDPVAPDGALPSP